MNLALGLGKTIVDGGVTWTYSPAYLAQAAAVCFGGRMFHGTQNEFWAVNMGKPPAYDPVSETEYMEHASLNDAEMDGLCVLWPLPLIRDAIELYPGQEHAEPESLISHRCWYWSSFLSTIIVWALYQRPREPCPPKSKSSSRSRSSSHLTRQRSSEWDSCRFVRWWSRMRWWTSPRRSTRRARHRGYRQGDGQRLGDRYRERFRSPENFSPMKTPVIAEELGASIES